MTIGLLFWVIFVIIIVFGGYWGYSQPGQRWFAGGGILVLLELFLLGWKVFGFIVQG